MNRVITSDADTGSATHMSENIGHGFGLGHDFGYDFGHAGSELYGINEAKIKDQFWKSESNLKKYIQSDQNMMKLQLIRIPANFSF